jgi:hypothetical protein
MHQHGRWLVYPQFATYEGEYHTIWVLSRSIRQPVRVACVDKAAVPVHASRCAHL